MMKPLYIGAIVVVIVVVAAIGLWLALGTGVSAASAAVVSGDNVSVYYTGSFTNGTVFNTNVGGQPFNFTVGANEVIPGFDQAVIGMKVGQNKTVTIPANDAYGQADPALIVSVSKQAFGNETITPGTTVTETSATGQAREGLVTSVNATNVTVDFNPPLAGKTLVFKIEMLNIKK